MWKIAEYKVGQQQDKGKRNRRQGLKAFKMKDIELEACIIGTTCHCSFLKARTQTRDFIYHQGLVLPLDSVQHQIENWKNSKMIGKLVQNGKGQITLGRKAITHLQTILHTISETSSSCQSIVISYKLRKFILWYDFKFKNCMQSIY